jgi:hypothetical protein
MPVSTEKLKISRDWSDVGDDVMDEAADDMEVDVRGGGSPLEFDNKRIFSDRVIMRANSLS